MAAKKLSEEYESTPLGDVELTGAHKKKPGFVIDIVSWVIVGMIVFVVAFLVFFVAPKKTK